MRTLFGALYYSLTLYSQAEFEKNITINTEGFLKEIKARFFLFLQEL